MNIADFLQAISPVIELLLRWLHIVVGITWIGSSFYFNHLDLSLREPEEPPQPIPNDLKEKLLGDMWEVHGGGFYYIQKFKVVPEKLPKRLIWHYWPSYLTWISGFCLLTIMYFFGAKLNLIDSTKLDIQPWQASAIVIALMALSWFVYDLICKSPLGKSNGKTAAIGFPLLIAVAFGLTQIFTGKGAYIVMGAIIGTLMSTNVFRMIIPGMRRLVKAMEDGTEVNPADGKLAKQRSFHNNYFTLPILFIMISNHYSFTYSQEFNWAVLAFIALGSAGVRHWFNMRNRGELNRWILPVVTLMIIALSIMTFPKKTQGRNVSFKEAKTIIQTRCIQCHSEKPLEKFRALASTTGFRLDTKQQIIAGATKIRSRVSTNSMPLANQTQMTKEERKNLILWVDQGAKTK